MIEDLPSFVAVCEEGSIAGGARRMGVPRATLSRRISKLERELGVRLLHRTTRVLTRTAEGNELYARARRIVDDAKAARRAVAAMDGTPRGLLRLSVPPELGESLHSILIDFLDRYPEVELEVVASSRFVDLAAEGFDAALRGGTLTDSSLIARRLFSLPFRAHASPDYIERHGLPRSLEELRSHNCIRSFSRGTVPQSQWRLLDGGTVAVHGRFSTNSMRMIEHTVRAGRGIAMLPTRIDGLVQVLPDLLGFTGSVSVLYPERTLLSPKVRALIDHLVDHLKEIPLRSEFFPNP